MRDERLNRVDDGSHEGDDAARINVDGPGGQELLNILNVGANVVDSVDAALAISLTLIR